MQLGHSVGKTFFYQLATNNNFLEKKSGCIRLWSTSVSEKSLFVFGTVLSEHLHATAELDLGFSCASWM